MGRRSFVPSVLPLLAVLTLGIALTGVGVAAARSANDQAGPTNRLAKESSPYLRQHGHNPVDWFPWGPEAFEKAKKDSKLIFLSIGYSACHWCHVMERESFANADVAKLMNASFVCIKVDREERPDIDQIYMTALQALGQRGGWPLSMFLTADAKPIIGGTYWPPDDREINGEKVHGFKSVLRVMSDIEKERPQELRERAEEVARVTTRALARTGKSPIAVEPNRTLVDAAIDELKGEFDPQHGGFGGARRNFKGTKFPVPPYLDLLTQVGQRQKSEDLLGMVTKTLDHMARGGLYDQLGGGFHRYSTERTWTIPHFEKMLYDNAQLVEVYARAFRQTQNPLYRRVVEETLEFVRRDLTSPDGAFYSALDADSDGEEGRYYVWTAPELEAALPDRDESALAKRAFGVDAPNFEGKYCILTRPGSANELDDIQVQEVRQKLLASRAKRARPTLDTKVLTAWNGQMIAGYAVAGQLLDEPRYTKAAVTAADFVLNNLRTSEGRLLRTYGAAPGEPSRAKLTGYLDDYAYLTHGLLCLHDANGGARWLAEARALSDLMIRYHSDADGGFFYTASDHEKLFARAKDQHDGAQPSGNSVAVRNLVRLAAKTGEGRYRDLAAKTLKSFASSLQQEPINLTAMVAALDLYLNDADGQARGLDQPLPGAQDGGAKRSDSVVKSTATADKPDASGKQTVTIKLAIEKEWHLYANPIGNVDLESSQTTLSVAAKDKPLAAKIEYPKGKLVKDPLIGDYAVYEGEISIKAIVERAAGDNGPVEITLKFTACSDKTCLLPATVKLTVP